MGISFDNILLSISKIYIPKKLKLKNTKLNKLKEKKNIRCSKSAMLVAEVDLGEGSWGACAPPFWEKL